MSVAGGPPLLPLSLSSLLSLPARPSLPVAVVLSHATGWTAWVGAAACVLALGADGARWLRVAQREHYIPGAASRFAVRWWRSDPVSSLLVTLGLAGVFLSGRWALCALAAAGAAVLGPLRLSVRGRTSKLVWTRRLKTLACAWAVLQAAVIGVGVGLSAAAPFAAAGCLASPALVDVALLATWPIERRLSQRYVQMASERLARVQPTIVGITGSYGKTSTKNHVAHLVSGSRAVVASPASFNNRVGLARAVNEQLAEGTEVFVAEMGTYGPGEIRALCSWCPPSVAVITALGPVHLERFGSEDAILTAKTEITERAPVVVLNVDDARLAGLADRLAVSGQTVVRCSTQDGGADVYARPSADGRSVALTVGGRVVDALVGEGVQPGNLACAVAVALQLGVPLETIADRIPSLPAVANRLTVGVAPSGVHVIDDTFNSNPAGSRAALALLGRAPVAAPAEGGAGGAGSPAGKRVVVTPGMIELGPRQAEENEAFARAAAEIADCVIVVGRTNRRALVRGAKGTRVVVVAKRDDAVGWVRTSLGPGDAVLYENDLPDHYP